VILKLFSKSLKDLFEVASLKFEVEEISDNSKRIYALQDEYIKIIDSVIFFYRENPTFAANLSGRLFAKLLVLRNWKNSLGFGTMGRRQAKHLARCTSKIFRFYRGMCGC
jgi:hypothetical protein